MQTNKKYQEDVDVLEQVSKNHEIVLHNDDINTFDFVIESLVGVCEHTYEQAEQCTILVHYKGKCTVKTGDLKKLKPQCVKLQDLGLSAELM